MCQKNESDFTEKSLKQSINASAINGFWIDFLHFGPLHKEIVGNGIYHFACNGFTVQLGKAFHINNPASKQPCEQASWIRCSCPCGYHRSRHFDDEINERKDDVPTEFESTAVQRKYLRYDLN